ncbi:isocitrate lyase/phosphoenolpyruvate mutase family protein [Siculibacillus lacustris]|uniref:Isocitrate lyase/phosphoenolpyruvate mutase family protein n=1 Tax=Siculibacillus lacustris TaxID=1549641 RepID=A0A4Q9VUP9_9HYPH|nr:isocitrate lyase/phosphoenolpyruvate mutase family protein [Siculibacillus lacustris]TBW39796.1 isocitrate lyase/phosphoenolpyruvate mutase family protein [Siculibacillus lacustris]
MAMALVEKRARFRRLHEAGCHLLPNPWDLGGARRLEALGFEALATTSSGLAWSLGKADGEATLDEVLAHLRHLCPATDLPINADFEDGYAASLADLARNVAAAIDTGVCGLSIEDQRGGVLSERSAAVDRLTAARAAIDASGADVILVGRAEGILLGAADLADTVGRLVAYAEAGADCLYAPCVADLGAIAEIVAAVAPKPVNVLLWGAAMRVDALAALGVRRVSLGGALAAAAWTGFETAARRFRDEGAVAPRDPSFR